MESSEVDQLMEHFKGESLSTILPFGTATLLLLIIRPLLFAPSIRLFQRLFLIYLTLCLFASQTVVYSGVFDKKHPDHEEAKMTLQNGDLAIETARIFLMSEAILPPPFSFMISSMICATCGNLWQTLHNAELLILVLTLFNMMTKILAYFCHGDPVVTHLLPFSIFRAAVITVEYFKVPLGQVIMEYSRCHMCIFFCGGVIFLTHRRAIE